MSLSDAVVDKKIPFPQSEYKKKDLVSQWYNDSHCLVLNVARGGK